MAAYYTAMAKEAGAVVKRVKPAKLKAMCETDSHQGVAAWASQIEYATLEQLLDSAAQKGEPPFLVLADGVEDPTTWAQFCARRCCAGRMAWSFPSGAAWASPARC